VRETFLGADPRARLTADAVEDVLKIHHHPGRLVEIIVALVVERLQIEILAVDQLEDIARTNLLAAATADAVVLVDALDECRRPFDTAAGNTGDDTHGCFSMFGRWFRSGILGLSRLKRGIGLRPSKAGIVSRLSDAGDLLVTRGQPILHQIVQLPGPLGRDPFGLAHGLLQGVNLISCHPSNPQALLRIDQSFIPKSGIQNRKGAKDAKENKNAQCERRSPFG
jgi:hypothetical protein